MTDNVVNIARPQKQPPSLPATPVDGEPSGASRGEHVRLLVTALNIAAAGLAVGVALTIPLAALTTGHISGPDEVLIELAYASSAVVAHGAAQLILWRFG